MSISTYLYICKVLVFSQFTSMLGVLEELFRLRSWGFERIDGQISAEERQERIRRSPLTSHL